MPSTPTRQSAVPESWYRNTLLAIAGGAIVLQVAAFGPLRDSLWGFHLFAFTPPFVAPLAWAIIIIAALGLRWPADTVSDRLLGGLARRPVVSTVALAVVLTAIFWLLRSQQTLLGDALPLTVDLPTGKSFHPRQPLAMWLQQALYSTTGSWFDGSGLTAPEIAHRTVAVGSVASGFAFVLTASALGHTLVRGAKHAAATPWLIALVMLTQGYAVLFFGYVENYTYYALFIALYLLVAVRYIQGRLPLGVVAAVLVVCMGMHLSTVALLPSFLFLAGRGLYARPRRVDAWAGIAVLALSLFLLDAVIRSMSPGDSLAAALAHVTAVARNAQGGGAGISYMLSGAHFRDFVSEHYLVGPFAAFLFLPALAFGIHRRLLRDPVSVFLALAAVFYLAGSWATSEPLLGYARDWDIFAPAGICYAAAGLYLLTHHIGNAAGTTGLLRFALIVSFINVVPFVWINHSAERSLERMKTLPLGKGRTEVVVGNYYRREGDLVAAQDWFERALEVDRGNINAIALLASLYAEQGDYGRAAAYMQRAVDMRPDKVQFRDNLVEALLEQQRCADAQPHMMWLAERTPERLNYWQRQGDILLRLGCAGQLDAVYEPVLRYVDGYLRAHPTDEEHAINAGIFLGKLGRLDESLARFQSCLEIDPESPAALFNAGVTLERLGRSDEARPLLERFLRLFPDHPLADTARRILG